MHYTMLDRAESGETRLTIHLYGHTIDNTECGSPCIQLCVKESNYLRSHTCTVNIINNAQQVTAYKQTITYNNSEVKFSMRTRCTKTRKNAFSCSGGKTNQ